MHESTVTTLMRVLHAPLETYLLLAGAYVLLPAVLYPLVAKRIRAARAPMGAGCAAQTQILVVTPAHDEEVAIRRLAQSVAAQDYPRERSTHVVVADNCTDATAARARAGGATVWERLSEGASDKTQALRYASDRISEGAGDLEPDYIVVIDADSELPPDYLRELDAAIQDRPLGAYQTYRRVSNPGDGALAAMDAASEELRQLVHLGVKDVLGIDAHLHGNGTAFRTDLFHACARGPQEPFADDKAWKATLTELGERVGWVGAATVLYSVVTREGNFQNQRKRWITGQIEMIRKYSLRMLALGLRRGDASALDFGLSMLQLPRTFLLVETGYLALVSAVAPSITTGSVWLYGILAAGLFGYGLLGYVVGGLPIDSKAVFGTGARAVTGVAASTLRVLFGNKTRRWAALRK